MLSGGGNLSTRGHLSRRQNNIFSYIFVKYVRVSIYIYSMHGDCVQ